MVAFIVNLLSYILINLLTKQYEGFKEPFLAGQISALKQFREIRRDFISDMIGEDLTKKEFVIQERNILKSLINQLEKIYETKSNNRNA